MSEWLAPGIVIAIVLAVGGWVWHLATRLAVMEGRVSTAELLASGSSAKASSAEKDLADFKASVARDYASIQALAASETRLASAIEGIRGDFRGMTERIDRLLSVVQSGHA